MSRNRRLRSETKRSKGGYFIAINAEKTLNLRDLLTRERIRSDGAEVLDTVKANTERERERYIYI